MKARPRLEHRPLEIGRTFDPDARLGFGVHTARTWRELADDRVKGRPYLASLRGSFTTGRPTKVRAGIALEVLRKDGVFDVSRCSPAVALAVVGYVAQRLGLKGKLEWKGKPIDDERLTPRDLNEYALWLIEFNSGGGSGSGRVAERRNGATSCGSTSASPPPG